MEWGWVVDGDEWRTLADNMLNKSKKEAVKKRSNLPIALPSGKMIQEMDLHCKT